MSQSLLSKRNPDPPPFVMWKSVAEEQSVGWEREWFGHELDPSTVFDIRGIGIREPMFNANVDRPIGTGDWLIMFFHERSRLDPIRLHSLTPGKSLILWPPGSRQFYSWNEKPGVEPHSWMHVEGTWVQQQIERNALPIQKPVFLEDETVMTDALKAMMAEMKLGRLADPTILRNQFENWARSVARCLQTADTERRIPAALFTVQRYLDEHFTLNTPLDELARMSRMSRSYLCHQFRKYFGSSISEYVIRKRMSAAQRLLYDMNLRPGEIAQMVGYPDIYQFSKQFKKSFRISPSQYRRQQATNE